MAVFVLISEANFTEGNEDNGEANPGFRAGLALFAGPFGPGGTMVGLGEKWFGLTRLDWA